MIIYESVNRSSTSHSSHVLVSYGNFCCGPDLFVFLQSFPLLTSQSLTDILTVQIWLQASDKNIKTSPGLVRASWWKHTLKAHWLEKPALTRVFTYEKALIRVLKTQVTQIARNVLEVVFCRNQDINHFFFFKSKLSDVWLRDGVWDFIVECDKKYLRQVDCGEIIFFLNILTGGA